MGKAVHVLTLLCGVLALPVARWKTALSAVAEWYTIQHQPRPTSCVVP